MINFIISFKYIVDDDESKEWKLYDAGPKQVKCPLVCFPPASGTADVFYKQLLALSAVGYRVISVRVHFNFLVHGSCTLNCIKIPVGINQCFILSEGSSE